jgi:repressor LexA
MNKKGIKDGDLVLVRQQVMAQNGETVVALVDGEVTIKEFQKSSHLIVLQPRSTNSMHKSIVLTDNVAVQGVIITILPSTI